jgi:CsoR family transcriptional regulator, copper-sensing transcriptional repressor
MVQARKADVLARLTAIGVHVRGIRAMVEEDRRCADILRQTCAVELAIDEVEEILLAGRLARWIRGAGPVRPDDEMARQILELFAVSKRRGSRPRRPRPTSEDGTPCKG